MKANFMPFPLKMFLFSDYKKSPRGWKYSKKSRSRCISRSLHGACIRPVDHRGVADEPGGLHPGVGAEPGPPAGEEQAAALGQEVGEPLPRDACREEGGLRPQGFPFI